jgi:hypothetical protein
MRYIIILILGSLLLSNILSAQPTTWQALTDRIPGLTEQRVRHLQQSYTVEEIEPNVLKITSRETGITCYVDISDRQFNFDNPPPNVQVIDLINADTALYYHKYTRKAMLLVAGALGYPMVIGDFNNNNKLDFVGGYKIPQNINLAECAIVELKSDTTFSVQKVYYDSVVFPLAATDVDQDGLVELDFRHGDGQSFTNYESSHPDSFPDSLNLSHRMWIFGGAVSSETFMDLDKDCILDVLYVGDDSLPPSGRKIFVAEYDPLDNEFEKKFSMRPPNTIHVSGFSVNDFDNDGFLEFTTGSIFGDVHVFENTENDIYQLIFSDTISISNAYLTTATNDIDDNGKIEFFVGGTGYYNGSAGSRVYWFEADGNNHYQKIRSFFLMGTNLLGLFELYNYDVNNDGVDDLIFSFSIAVVILVWNPAGHFDLFYLDWWENYNQEIHSVNIYDIFGTGEPDLFVSVTDIVTTPRIKSYYYKKNPLTGISDPITYKANRFRLYQNYPNPFNGLTKIRFQLPKRSQISLTIYDITGKEVIHLIQNQSYAPSEHEINWNGLNNEAKEVSSGIYLYELTAGSFREVKKMLFIK